MAGHSKWSKVKHQKSLTDKVKAQTFTKASRAITVAVREGGGKTNPEENAKLRLAIEKAKSLNMPKDTIDRAIARASKDGDQQLESLVYEAYGPGGVALIIFAVTDNRQRTVSQIKNILDHHGGTLVSPGSVMFQFERVVNNAGIEYQPKHFVDLPENEHDSIHNILDALYDIDDVQDIIHNLS